MNGKFLRALAQVTFATTFTFATTTAQAAPTELAGPSLQQDAPAFTLRDTHGKEHKLSDFQGKIVVLEWYNPGCPFVQKHYASGNMQSLQKKYGDRDDIVWLLISSSAQGKQGHLTPEAHNKQLTDWKAKPDALLIDESGEVGRKYGAATTPHMFIIDTKGQLVYKGAIDDKPTTREEDVAGATNYVTAALESLLAGTPIANASTKPYGCAVKY